MTKRTTDFDGAGHPGADTDGQDLSDFIHALNIAARAKGTPELAEQAGMSRADLDKALAGGGNPRFGTVAKIVGALGCKLVVSRLP